MSPRSQAFIVVLTLVAAFILCWFHRDGYAAFLALIGGSPVASAINAVLANKKPAAPQSAPAADPAPPGP